MKGHNVVTHQFLEDDGALLVHGDPWYTIQGEGPDAGCPAIFVRLAKCNLRCYFCDTDFEHGSHWSVELLSEAILTLSSEHLNCPLVVITGGEPLLQNIIPLIDRLNENDIRVSIETAGTVWVDGLEKRFSPGWIASGHRIGNLIVCSPKTPKLNPRIPFIVGAYKYIIRHGEVSAVDGLPIGPTQLGDSSSSLLYRKPPAAPGMIFVQPMDEENRTMNHLNTVAAAASAMKFGYRLSCQLHKLADVD